MNAKLLAANEAYDWRDGWNPKPLATLPAGKARRIITYDGMPDLRGRESR